MRLLPALLVPRYARSVDVWLFDDVNDALRGGPHPAAAVLAARRGRPQYAADHPGGLPGVDDQPPSAIDPGRPLLCIPLLTRRASQGVLTLSPPDARWDADDAVMLIELPGGPASPWTTPDASSATGTSPRPCNAPCSPNCPRHRA